ncbi:MAG: di-trans,poly-cis-decaprenylcistransferase [Candidatus Magasanikbacteria bacterium RIFOXYD2_FULL_39_9]|uniref:Isoprenyl transferase n=1 Tax=Candidatus Magasanikbacteria bacterium RIFOXYD1_FULL_40_23 TaxID=1798705 RepID=A0A1F6PBI8_9BACT|nr:MAG: di-trans,poly-cis-decaprenylcistransferase [Candidatus Magasanikbacteria bacterium RIFOXYD2_FULL_39_9]OGH93324.1 MAG: di-trans,poly-cis-decaprenylcistransferase [Candidatus Magasanikbacteria bacterium RIFOXYD1_FULL_40_23]
MKNIIPQHIAIILDGNRRWAKEKKLPTFFGHKKGMENAKKMILYAQKVGVQVVTMYAFSTENWSRSEKEVGYLMKLFENYIDKYIKEYSKHGIKFRHIGAIEKLPASLQKKIKNAIELTKNNTGMVANLALNYGGRDEIKRAVQKLVSVGVKAKDITLDLIGENLDTAGLPDPDLIIRTSGEQRTSGFLIWQGAYSELYFPKCHWPDFDEKELDKAINEFNKRQRRFGK